ncbi:MAG: hypothetical protein GY788_29535 [bacterium]|nr:hypothetical protein [bacterium]
MSQQAAPSSGLLCSDEPNFQTPKAPTASWDWHSSNATSQALSSVDLFRNGDQVNWTASRPRLPISRRQARNLRPVHRTRLLAGVAVPCAVVAAVRVRVDHLGSCNRSPAIRKQPKIAAICGVGQAAFGRGQIMNLVVTRIWLGVGVDIEVPSIDPTWTPRVGLLDATSQPWRGIRLGASVVQFR